MESSEDPVHIEKWQQLSRLRAERVLFLDADTICMRPLELLFERYRAEDIYAREEAGTCRSDQHRPDELFPAQIDWRAFDRQRGPVTCTFPCSIRGC